MDWSNERYVRLYTRDTPGWLMMGWQARATLALLLRKFDRAGVIDLAEFAGEGAATVIATMIGLPVDIVAAGLADLIKRKTLVAESTCLVMPNYIEAQEASQSDKMRKAEQRSRTRERALAPVSALDVSRNVTKSHAESQAVTSGHTRSHGVTPSLAVPSLAVPSRADVQRAPAAPDDVPKLDGSKKGTRLPDGWEPRDNSWRDIAQGRGFSESDVTELLAEFRDYWRARPGQDATKLDWDATWRCRLRQARQPAGKSGQYRTVAPKQAPATIGEHDWSAAAKAKAKVV